SINVYPSPTLLFATKIIVLSSLFTITSSDNVIKGAVSIISASSTKTAVNTISFFGMKKTYSGSKLTFLPSIVQWLNFIPSSSSFATTLTGMSNLYSPFVSPVINLPPSTVTMYLSGSLLNTGEITIFEVTLLKSLSHPTNWYPVITGSFGGMAG